MAILTHPKKQERLGIGGTTMTETLKPCPFCGTTPVIETHRVSHSTNYDDDIISTSIRIFCRLCGITSTWFTSLQTAIAFWNRRTGNE